MVLNIAEISPTEFNEADYEVKNGLLLDSINQFEGKRQVLKAAKRFPDQGRIANFFREPMFDYYQYLEMHHSDQPEIADFARKVSDPLEVEKYNLLVDEYNSLLTSSTGVNDVFVSSVEELVLKGISIFD